MARDIHVRTRKHLCRSKVVIIMMVLMALLIALPATAGTRWDTAGSVVTTAEREQRNPKIVSDGAGGAIIAWENNTDGQYHPYCQRVDSSGNRTWFRPDGLEPDPTNPYDRVRVSNTSIPQATMQMASDGSQGAYLTWQDTRTGNLDIYAQRMAADSYPPTGWGVDGNRINDVLAGEQSEPQIAPDGSNGAVITWQDFYNATTWYVRANRILPAGAAAPGWPVYVEGQPQAQKHPQITQTQDGSGDVIVAYQLLYDSVSIDPDTDWAVYVNKVQPNGGKPWGGNGINVTLEHINRTWSEEFPQICSDGGGGAFISWQDDRSSHRDTYIQKLDSNGVRAAGWPDEGVAVSGDLTMDESNQKIVPDGNGGAIVVWQIGNHIEANRLDSSGAKMWGDTGMVLGYYFSIQDNPQVIADGQGGAIVTWQQHDAVDTKDHVYAQKVSSSGTKVWGDNGLVACDNPENQQMPTIASDGKYGGIVVWQDDRNAATTGLDIYGQRVSNDPPAVTSITPRSGTSSLVTNITNLAGTGFLPGAAVKLKKAGQPDINATNVNVVSDTQITCRFTLTGDPVTGPWDVFVQNVDGQNYTKAGIFTINVAPPGSRAPAITGLSPTTAAPGDVLTITGNNFGDTRGGAGGGTAGGAVEPSYVSFGGTHANDYVSWSTTRIEVYVPSGATSGNVSVVTGAGGASNARAVTIIYPRWYLAEGSTAWGFSCYVSIENPNAAPVNAKITYMPTGSSNVVKNVTLPASSQTTISPADVLGEKDFSTLVECTTPGKSIAVDRTMKWTAKDSSYYECHSSVGVSSPAKQWFLPEGSSAWGFECWLLIQNPNASKVTAHVTYMIEGGTPVNVDKEIPANSRKTFNIADDIGNKDASIQVSCDQGIGIIPERAMYRNQRREGHDSIGTTNSATDYFLAEGTTAWGFTSYVLVQNPNETKCDVTVTYMTNDGPKPQAKFTMDALSRKTIRVNDVMPDKDFSTQVHSNMPIIAERAMYWDNGTGEACHDSIGMDAAHSTFYLPDGKTSTDNGGVESWTLVQNPDPETAVKVRITYLTGTGKNNVSWEETIPAASRRTFSMADKLSNTGASVMVVCQTPGKKIMVERAMYWNSREAGTDTIGGYAD